MKIDLVYLYVDNNDKNWIEKRDYWFEKSDTTEYNICRYSQNDELRYSLRSAELYAPWINKIFIVTDNQIPKWLDLNNPKIKIIDHKDIMPEYALPCFNSNAIEACIDNIEDLSEHFLYANDDIFFSSVVKPEDFFDENFNPIVNLKKCNFKEINNTHQQNILYSIELFKSKFDIDKNLSSVEPYHLIDAYKKSIFRECKEQFREAFNNTINHKFRCKNSIQRIIISLYMLKNSSRLNLLPENSDEKSLYFNLNQIDMIEEKIKRVKPKQICINDEEDTQDINRKNLKHLLYKLYNKKSSYEKKEELLINPVFNIDNSNCIVYSFNDSYAKYFSASFQSLISNSSKNEQYDIVIFSSNLSEDNKNLIESMAMENFNIRFFDISQYIYSNFDNINFTTPKYWSIEIYFRLFIPLLMKNYKKILYLDCDTIINSNLKELFSINFKEGILAIKDTITAELFLEKHSERLSYMKNTLKLKNLTNYFNSGVLLFNIESIDKKDYKEKLKEALNTKNLLFPDQDILNILFENNIYLTSRKWNYLWGGYIYNENFANYFKGKDKKDFLEAQKNPNIIHYSSEKKPWNSKMQKGSEIFWKYARKTPYYEEILRTREEIFFNKKQKETMKHINLYMKMHSNKRIVLWGASQFLKDFIEKYDIISSDILGVIDTNTYYQNCFIGKYEIFSPDDLKKLNPDEIIITIINNTEKRKEEIENYIKKTYRKNIKLTTI